MSNIVWSFKTRNFRIVCNGEPPSFIDPLAHDQWLIDLLDSGEGVLENLTAYVYWRDVEVGRAHKFEAIHGSGDVPENSPYSHAFIRMVVTDKDHRRDVVRWAISDARKALAELQGDMPGLYLREKT